MIDALTTLLSSQMMQRSLLAALIVGLTAPIIGTYLVHRRLAMLGDGIGHISLTGVALGWLAGTFANVSPADSWAIPGAVSPTMSAARRERCIIWEERRVVRASIMRLSRPDSADEASVAL